MSCVMRNSDFQRGADIVLSTLKFWVHVIFFLCIGGRDTSNGQTLVGNMELFLLILDDAQLNTF